MMSCIPQMKRFDSPNESSRSVFLDKKDSPGERCIADAPMVASQRFYSFNITVISPSPKSNLISFSIISELNWINRKLSDTILLSIRFF